MQALVPFDARHPKSRLSDVLDDDERQGFARAMLADVLDALDQAGHSATVLSTAPVECDAPVVVDDRPLTTAVNDALDDRPLPVSIVMADLALVTPDALDSLFETAGDVVLAPGLGGGTNALAVRHHEFQVDYHGTSVHDHRENAKAVDADLGVVDSYRLGIDIDDPMDLIEVLLHNNRRARAWLVDAGFRAEAHDGRATVTRPDGKG
ncbi:2-phospho-L-lactate guanylyltransferase [Halovenus salina]|uniref:2-phospho-L-lactate guanylyltransferase n=1 Tax=Halovenus salina TaxID=1510225 RepID=A0ABD5WAG2_9EURY|nr:2-phospho-L-lactate guanylyltransferase [Halovenus salina]